MADINKDNKNPEMNIVKSEESSDTLLSSNCCLSLDKEVNKLTNDIENPKHTEDIEKKKKKKKKSKKKVCSIDDCNNPVHEILGICKWCPYKFCTEHRIPEAHACIGLKNCKQNSYEKNAALVGSMKCIASKVV